MDYGRVPGLCVLLGYATKKTHVLNSLSSINDAIVSCYVYLSRSILGGLGVKLLLPQQNSDLRDLSVDLLQFRVTSREGGSIESAGVIDHIVQDLDRARLTASHALLADHVSNVGTVKARRIHRSHDRIIIADLANVASSSSNEVKHAGPDESVVMTLAISWVHPFVSLAASVVRAAPVGGLAVANRLAQWAHASCALVIRGARLTAVARSRGLSWWGSWGGSANASR